MKISRIVACLLFVGFGVVPHLLLASHPHFAVQADEIAVGRKSVTIFANNTAQASSKAQAENPGWTVVSVKKSATDPKSRAYTVVLKK